MATTQPDYGVDAPGVVRNLAIVAVAGQLLHVSARWGWWSGIAAIPIGDSRLIFPLASMGAWAGFGCAAMAIWMVWSSKVGKIRERDQLLSKIAWTGREHVLDVGCGRGLMLIGAAKRLTTGKATGIDLWQAQDLSGNRPDATRANIECEGVADKVEVMTSDMRTMPFPEASFDVVVSRAAIHNLYAAADRTRAIAEIARVLKPGGRAIIDDIRHHGEYLATFAAHGCTGARIGSPIVRLALALITMGSLQSDVILVTKRA
jgi:SAM-dependent methyltransferase